MLKICVNSIRCFFVFSVLCGVLYPLLIQVVAAVGFHNLANGSLIYKNDQLIGSRFIGQSFVGTQYFQSRPSATTPAYNATDSSSSNAAVTDPAYLATVKSRIEEIKKMNPEFKGDIPMDAVTASASGLDPHISPENAHMQAARVAKARKMDVLVLNQLIDTHTDGEQWGLLGRPRVNVLELNMAIDETQPHEPR